jgi:membrane associated rhomboid family serine protease
MDSAAFHAGDWWRACTAVLLHADGRHLAANITTGTVLLGLTLGRYGTGVGLSAAFLAGVAGNLLGALVYPGPYRSLGASGMMMGALGLLAVQSAAYWRQAPRAARGILAGAAGGLMLFLLLGSNPSSDLVAHAGGFVAGCGLGTLLSLGPQARLRSDRTQLLGGLVLFALVVIPWWLALR